MTEAANDNSQNSTSNLLVPTAIIVAGLMVAVAIIITNRNGGIPRLGNGKSLGSGTQELSPTPPQPTADLGSPQNVKAVSGQDHIFGEPSAAVKIIEFSDLECPFCKDFHPMMKKIVAEYQGKVAWIYRHFPLDSIHPKARKEAEAAECANELGGNEKFWAYIDRLFEITPSNNGLDPQKLPQIATDVGLDQDKFETCLTSGKYAQRVVEDLDDARRSGGRGTPYSIVLTKDGRKLPINGTVPYEQLKTAVEDSLR